MILQHFEPFQGENCEIATIGNLMKHAGLTLSEPMLFGIGEALGFLFWDSKQLGYPIFLGRCKQDVLTERIIRSLGIEMEINETSSISKAWNFVKTNLDNGKPVGMKLDCYYLEYFTQKIHFPAHYVTIYGYDDKDGYLIDTAQQNLRQKSSLASIADARNARGPMSSRNRAYTIRSLPTSIELRNIMHNAIHQNAEAYLHPPFRNANAAGIRKTAGLIPHWLSRPDLTPELIIQVGVLMDKAGTGGGLFRNMYRDFLEESSKLFPDLDLQKAYDYFQIIAPLWTEVSTLICSAGEKQQAEPLQKASLLLLRIADLEETAMRFLLESTAPEMSSIYEK